MIFDDRVYWYTVDSLVRNYDGDSFWAVVDIGFGFKAKLEFRLDGIDTPEMGQLGATLARNYLRTRIVDAISADTPVVLRSFKDDKYGRYLARLYIGPECLNETMISMKLGKPYDGGTRE